MIMPLPLLFLSQNLQSTVHRAVEPLGERVGRGVVCCRPGFTYPQPQAQLGDELGLEIGALV